jgi:cobalt-zinc-cadmium efflux system outer membrane protein
MKTNNQLRSLVLAAAIMVWSSAQADDAMAPLGANVQELLQWADTHNPDLATMNYEIDAAEGRIIPAGALPDPVLRVELMDFAGPAAPNGFTVLPNRAGGTKYTVMQSFPLWGKRDLRTEIATAGLGEAKSRRIAFLAEIHSKIKIAYAQFYQPFRLKSSTTKFWRCCRT